MEPAELERRGRAVLRLFVASLAVGGAGSISTAVGLGLAEHSIGWGFAGAFIFLGAGMCVWLLVAVATGNLGKVGRLYKQVARQMFGRRPPDSN
ncbi:MAG TPA: hypothetical protein VMU64_13400 [Acidimicrobiales bacterium]|nr:hypothetical protein [Acidimicrobiales bacterium]